MYEPGKKYNIIYADPPWQIGWDRGGSSRGYHAAANHYPVMPIADLKALNVKALADRNCALCLWVTGPTIADGIDLMRTWGFKYKTLLFTWVKLNRLALTPVMGLGAYTRANAELVLLGMRGHLTRLGPNPPVPQIVMTPRQGHSVKPDEVRDRIVTLWGDVPRIELFARQAVDGWDALGNDIEGQQDTDIRDVLV